MPERRRLWTRAECIAQKRCPDCEWHVKTQGHEPNCPTRKEAIA